MLYDLLKKCVSIFFNLLNVLLGGKLPPFGSAAVVVERNDYYLVVELPQDRIVFPGGFMNWEEHPVQAAIREGKEETGLSLRAGDMIGYYPVTSDSWTNMSTVSFVYQAQVVGGTLRGSAEGKPSWLHETELRKRIDAHSQIILNDYLRYRAQRQGAEAAQALVPVAS
jgi:ADP-ribose pyrophosphatase YjhB (NUDIX family)